MFKVVNDFKKKSTFVVGVPDSNNVGRRALIGRDEGFHSVILGNSSGTVLCEVITLYVDPR